MFGERTPALVHTEKKKRLGKLVKQMNENKLREK